MPTEQRRNFIAIVSSEPSGPGGYLINLDQVVMIDQIGPDHCRIWFSGAHAVELHGAAIAKFLAMVSERAIEVSGEDLSVSEQNIGSVRPQ